MNPSLSIGPMQRARRIVLFGPNGIGKGTLASQFPNPIFVDTEDGTANLDVARIQVEDFGQFTEACRVLLREYMPTTVVIDTIDATEKFQRQKLCAKHKKAGIEDFGFGKGYAYLSEEFELLLSSLDQFIHAGINVVVVGHSNVKRVYLPELADPFDRYELRLFDRNAARLREWSDAVLFINWNIRVQESASGRIRGLAGKERAIYTTHSAAYDAKNRAGLPEKVACEFSALLPLLAQPSKPEVKNDLPVTISQTAPPEPPASPAAPLTPPPTESATAKVLETLAPGVSVQDHLKDALFGLPADWIEDFLIDRRQINIGQKLSDVPAEYATAALERIREFREAITEFGRDHDNVPM